ncbi:MAG: hypothetical protein ACK4GL_10035 [Flavobacteriales bacterium]|jgi:hypothetical protein
MNYNLFYQSVGKLLYAIANADGKIMPQEKQRIRQLIDDELVKIETSTDRFGTDNAYHAEFAFDYAEENFLNPDKAFLAFEKYLHEHKTVLSPELKQLVYRLAEKTGEAYKGINEDERNYIDKLKKLLEV